jgi:hypothetical protein
MTRLYFRILGDGYSGSVVPLCSPGDRNRPNPDRLMYPSLADADLRYTLELVGIDPTGFTETSVLLGALEAPPSRTDEPGTDVTESVAKGRSRNRNFRHLD